MKPRLLFLFATVTGLTISGQSLANCGKYGCPDCSCVASTVMLQQSFPDNMLEIKKLLEAKGISPESVTITIEAPKEGQKTSGEVELPDYTTMEFRCFDGCICCNWTFRNSEPVE